jgi:glyoxylase-like metal-dependent hydrolase (beta-lactamase superfamily II)
MADASGGVPGVVRVLAPNPSPMTLSGTNSWVVEGWVVDPGPSIPGHVEALREAAGSVKGVVLTHSHLDHSEAAPALGFPARVPVEGEKVGPFLALATPGHSADSVCLLYGRVLFSGDTVLGEGSVFVAPGSNSLAAYMRSLERLLALDLDAICPGHGPVVRDPDAKLREYLAHRLEREERVVSALAGGARTVPALLSSAWSDVDLSASPILEMAAAATLAAHLEKLAAEGRLPADVPAEALRGPNFAA